MYDDIIIVMGYASLYDCVSFLVESVYDCVYGYFSLL